MSSSQHRVDKSHTLPEQKRRLLKRRRHVRVTKNADAAYSSQGTRAKGKSYGSNMHNLIEVDDDRTVAL